MSIPIAIQCILLLLSLYMLLRSITMYGSAKARYFILLTLACFFYVSGYLLELDAHSFDAAFTALRIEYCGIAFFGPLYYLFIRDYNNRSIKPKGVLLLLFLFPLLILALAISYPANKLYFLNIRFFSEPNGYLEIERGPFFYLHALYNFAFQILGAVEILLRFPRRTKSERNKRILFLLSIAIPSLSITTFLWNRFSYLMEIDSAALTISLLLLGYYILHRRPQDWLPYAREYTIEKIKDGYVLLDNEKRLLDANAVAMRYFPDMADMPAETPISQVQGFPVDLQEQVEQEFLLSTPDGEICLRASATPIRHEGKLICTCILFFDITEERKLMNQLAELAVHDSLTGLKNRGSFFWMAERDFAIHQRTRQPASILMIDIDHFKNVNDHYGHQSGDRVIKKITQMLLARLRSTDIGGRYGGEEFCVFLPATDLHGARRFAEEFREAVAYEMFAVDGAEIRITVSVGISEVNPDQHHTLQTLIADADAALYEAKSSGRNRVCCARSAVMQTQ